MPNDFRAKKRLEGFEEALAKAGLTLVDREYYSGGSALLKGREMTAAIREDVLEKIISGIPAGRMGQPEEIASMVSWLASEEGAYATGADFSVNGGLNMA